MKLKTYKSKDKHRIRVDTEHHNDYRLVTVRIKAWLLILILITIVLGILVLLK